MHNYYGMHNDDAQIPTTGHSGKSPITTTGPKAQLLIPTTGADPLTFPLLLSY